MEHSTEINPQTSKIPLLVTGSASYLGSHLMEKLKQLNLGITAVYRNKIPDQNSNIFPVSADLLIKNSLESYLSGVHTVIHLAWERTGEKSSSSNDPANSPNVQILKNLIESMEHFNTPRIIFVSVVGASRDSNSPLLKEKYICEQMIVNSNIKEKIIIRSAVLFGGHREAGFIMAVKNLMKSPLFYPVPMGELLLSPLHVEDLCDLISKCTLVKMYDFCAIVDLVGGEPYRVSQIFKIIAQKFNKNLIPIGSVLGNYLVKFMERKYSSSDPKVFDYFFIGGRIEKKIRHRNPLSKLLPEKCRTFQEL